MTQCRLNNEIQEYRVIHRATLLSAIKSHGSRGFRAVLLDPLRNSSATNPFAKVLRGVSTPFAPTTFSELDGHRSLQRRFVKGPVEPGAIGERRNQVQSPKPRFRQPLGGTKDPAITLSAE